MPMIEIHHGVLDKAEATAAKGASFEAVLAELRRLPLDDFGLLLLEMPNSRYPALSRVLPPMAPAEVQKAWTGASGLDLYKQTAAFMRIVAYNYARYRRKGLEDATILDFGVGYGRIFRMFYYYTNPDKLWGVDAWQRSLDHCSRSKLPGNFVLSDPVPQQLDVGDTKFDLMVSFSVFTHLSLDSAQACLAALRKHIAQDGLLVLTFRPVEFWQFIDGVRGTSHAAVLSEEHRRSGHAYLPHEGKEGATYGDTSLSPSFFDTEDWLCLGVDRGIGDSHQLIAILAPK